MQGRLNAIQKGMLQWNEMHPYNAVHVVQILGALDATHLQACITTTIEKRGLARLTLDWERFTFQYDGDAANCEIHTVAGPPTGNRLSPDHSSVNDHDQGPFCALVAEMERQLNLPFACTQAFSPFRFLVVPAGDSFYLGLVYFHPMADAESVVYLLKDIVTRYVRGDTPEFRDTFDLYPETGVHLLHRQAMVVVRKFLGLPEQMRNLRHSRRPHYADMGNMANGFMCFSLVPDDLRSLVTVARSWGVTINDVFLALLLKSLSPGAATRAESGKRRKISVGCIVNIRKDLGLDSWRAFGLFLGSFTVTHEVPVGISLRELAGDIRQQTLPVKRHKSYLGMPLELGFARFLIRFFSPARRKKFYPKHYPLWGGITNMNLNLLWEQRDTNALLDYFRGVSTGPVTPLVLSVTTVGDRVNMGLSYRTTVFSKIDIDNLQCRFRKHLQEMREGA